ncbi:hypothetical protein [Paenibacillus sp. S29]|uniref:hypothetical protein n=1 Tax=Paenibacillus sp. S29 TaxID=3394611 RepID=UPI003BC6A4B4
MVNEEYMSICEVAKRLNIQNKSQIQVWTAKTKNRISYPTTNLNKIEDNLYSVVTSPLKTYQLLIITI